MTECWAWFFLLCLNRSRSDQVFVLLSDIQATSMSRKSWLDLSTDLWLWECLGFPCTSFIPSQISAKFLLFCTQIRGHCRSAVWMGHRTYKICPLADRPLPRRFCFSGDEDLWTWPMVLIGHNESVISIWFRLHINQVYLEPRIHVMWKDWTYN